MQPGDRHELLVLRDTAALLQNWLETLANQLRLPQLSPGIELREAW